MVFTPSLPPPPPPSQLHHHRQEFKGGWRDLEDVSAHILELAGLGPVDTILNKADTAGRETAAFLASGVLQRLQEQEVGFLDGFSVACEESMYA